MVAPNEYASRAASHRLELIQELGLFGSEQVGVFVCTTAFPCVACPLFVYEPRYRLMIRRCVESGVRQFGMAACLNREATGSKRWIVVWFQSRNVWNNIRNSYRYAKYGTMLEIRDRVLLKDGCSILSTVAGRRFRVLTSGEKDGYDTAQVEFLTDTMVGEDQLMNLVELHEKVICLLLRAHTVLMKTIVNRFKWKEKDGGTRYLPVNNWKSKEYLERCLIPKKTGSPYRMVLHGHGGY